MEQEIESILGKELTNKYRELLPILQLIDYRIETRGKEGLFTYDGEYSETYSLMTICKNSIKYIEYCGKRIFDCRKREKQSLLSDTFFTLNRYDDVLTEIFKKEKVCAVITAQDCDIRNYYRCRGLDAERLKRRLVYLGESVAGFKLKLIIEKWFDFFSSLREERATCEACIVVADRLLGQMQKESRRRIKKIKKELMRNKINLYITINQYNLRDLLIILACKEAGIISRQLLHYSNCIIEIPLEEKVQSKQYVNELFVWDKSEKMYIEKYFDIIPIVASECRVDVAGCPELSYNVVSGNKLLWNRKNAIILFVPSYTVFLGEDYRRIENEKDRKILQVHKKPIFDGIHLLAEREHLEVYLRYYPNESDVYIKDDEDIIHSYGFKMLSDSREDLTKGLCWSKAAFSCMSSVLISALAYGCTCFSIDLQNRKYDFCGLDIHSVTPENISLVSINYPKTEEYEGFMNIDKLFAIHDAKENQ